MKDYTHYSQRDQDTARCGKKKTGYMRWTHEKKKVQCPTCIRLYLQDEAAAKAKAHEG